MTIIDELYQVLQERKEASPKDSYVASLYGKGAEKMCAKIREEAEEVIVEALALNGHESVETIRNKLKGEAVDLMFHLWILLAHYNITPDDIHTIFQERFGISGHTEKASRDQ